MRFKKRNTKSTICKYFRKPLYPNKHKLKPQTILIMISSTSARFFKQKLVLVFLYGIFKSRALGQIVLE